MLSMSLKTLNIILMCFDGKNNYLKKNKRKYSNSNNKRMSKVLKITLRTAIRYNVNMLVVLVDKRTAWNMHKKLIFCIIILIILCIP